MGTSGSGDKVASDEPADELGDLGDDGVTEGDDPPTSVQPTGNPISHSQNSGESLQPRVSVRVSPRLPFRRG
jgi:hypothetical protein